MIVNGEDLLEQEQLAQLEEGGRGRGDLSFQPATLGTARPITFSSHSSYIGLPQLKAYHDLSIYFQFRTLEPAGLLMFNGGQVDKFYIFSALYLIIVLYDRPFCY